jgi:hypothetical protein
MIASLVIPQTPSPEIIDIHRRNLTLVWEAVYYPSPQDKTSYGVNITVCQADVVIASQAQGLLSVTSSSDDDKVSQCHVITKEKKQLSEVNKVPSSPGEEEEEYHPQILSTPLRDLNASAEYQIRCPSSSSSSSITLPLSSPHADSQPSMAIPRVSPLHSHQH